MQRWPATAAIALGMLVALLVGTTISVVAGEPSTEVGVQDDGFVAGSSIFDEGAFGDCGAGEECRSSAADSLQLVQLRGVRTSGAAADSPAAAAPPPPPSGSASGSSNEIGLLPGARGAEFIPPIRRPVMFQNKVLPGYVLEFRQGGSVTVFECIAEQGGLVTALKLNGGNFLVDTPTGPSGVQGTTVWTSPQSNWGWPPPPAFVDAVYVVEVDEPGMSITLTGPVDNVTGLRLIKQFSLDLEAGVIRSHVTLRNEAADHLPRQAAPWIIMRLWPSGLTFFRRGEHTFAHGDLGYKATASLEDDDDDDDDDDNDDENGDGLVDDQDAKHYIWFQHEGSEMRDTGKLFANPSSDWIAHTDGKSILLVRFPHHRYKNHAPQESFAEVYALQDYEELEVQGRYDTIPPGGDISWETSWCLRRLPPGIPAVVGSTELTSYAFQVRNELEEMFNPLVNPLVR